MAKHILSVLVENHPGVLSRVAGLFSRRGFNIDSLAVGVTEKLDISRITIVVDGDDYTVEQVSKQLNKLIDVIKVKVLQKDDAVRRDLALIKVTAHTSTRSEIAQLVEIFTSKIVDVSKSTITIEISGSPEKVNALLDLVRPFGIKEVVRTGTIALERGNAHIKIKQNNEENEE